MLFFLEADIFAVLFVQKDQLFNNMQVEEERCRQSTTIVYPDVQFRPTNLKRILEVDSDWTPTPSTDLCCIICPSLIDRDCDARSYWSGHFDAKSKYMWCSHFKNG